MLDGLTGLNNRRHFLVLANNEWARFQRYKRPLALLMTDIDKFKSVNDTYGHDVGDEVIKGVAGVLQASKRTTDIVGRLGGEEFALVLPEATLESAVQAAERFRQLVANRVISAGDQRVPVTISLGVASADEQTTGIEEMLKQSDVALYEAKHTGRDRVCRFNRDAQSHAAHG